MATISQPLPRPALKAARRRSGFWHAVLAFFLDILVGAIYGDFARNLHVPGVVTQVALGFVPGVGTVCAIRDLIANFHFKDRFGVIVNFFALIPVFGGFAKIFDAIHDLLRLRHAIQRSRMERQQIAS